MSEIDKNKMQSGQNPAEEIDDMGDTVPIPTGVLFDWGETGKVPTEGIIAKEAQATGEKESAEFLGKDRVYLIDDINDTKGDGRQADIYFCRTQGDDREYVLKLYKENKIIEDKLTRVLQILQEKKSPYVGEVIEFGKSIFLDKQVFYVVLKKYVPLPLTDYEYAANVLAAGYEKRVLKLIHDINEGIKFLHENGICHCDIKPANLVYDKERDCVVLIDFGGSVVADARQEIITKSDEEMRLSTASRSVSNVLQAAAVTQRYLPREARGGKEITRRVDYFSLGVTLGELFNGVHPEDREALERKVGESVQVRFFYVAKNLPLHYQNLLMGLMYENEKHELVKVNRWDTAKLETWLQYVASGDYFNASQYANERMSGAVTAVADDEDSEEYKFTERINARVNSQRCSFGGLNEMADFFAENWDAGVNLMLRGTMFDPGKVGRDIMGEYIQPVLDKMQEAAERKGSGMSINAEFAKFLMEFVSDKSVFRWKGFEDVRDKQSLGKLLLDTLRFYDEDAYEFGPWQEKIGLSKTELGSEQWTLVNLLDLLSNGVLSTYLRESGETNQKLYEQCATIEYILESDEAAYTGDDIFDLYVLAYMLMGKQDYEACNGRSYGTYEEFLADMNACAQSEERVDEVFDIWQQVRDEENRCYQLEFLAWMQVSHQGR